jgi:aminoglycoside 3-N-acetyltransferase
MLSFNDLVLEFTELGLKNGDIVLVHSSYKSFSKVEGGPQTVIDALLSVIGAEGTLIAPTFNFDFCQGKPFDIRKTPSQMGVITELVRNNPQSIRVFHPIYSFSIIGKLAGELGNLRYKSSYGKDSIFGKLRELDGKIMVIGLPYNHSMTFFHHIEEMEGCDYRYFKDFKGLVTDNQGKTYDDTFTMFVRDIDKGVETAVDPMGEILEQEGVVNLRKIGEAIVRLMKANDVYRITAIKMKENPYLLYQVNPAIKRSN